MTEVFKTFYFQPVRFYDSKSSRTKTDLEIIYDLVFNIICKNPILLIKTNLMKGS